MDRNLTLNDGKCYLKEMAKPPNPKLTLKNTSIESVPKGYYFFSDCPNLMLNVNTNGTKRTFFIRVRSQGYRGDYRLGYYSPFISDADRKSQLIAVKDGLIKESEILLTPKEADIKARSRLLELHGSYLPVPHNNVSLTPSFGEYAKEYHLRVIDPHRKMNYSKNWIKSLEIHLPKIWNKNMDDVTYTDIRDSLSSIWNKIPETSRRIRNRIISIMDDASKAGVISIMPAIPNETNLGPQNRQVMSYKFLPWTEIYELYSALKKEKQNEIVLLTRLIILTACRNKEAREATWEEFDLDKKIWSIPASRMKNKKIHRVPLTNETLNVLNLCKAINPESEYVFGKIWSDQACIMHLRRHHNFLYTLHGFRTTFRTFAAENNINDTVAEFSLSHYELPRVQVNYYRTDLLEQRRKILKLWHGELLDNYVTMNTIDNYIHEPDGSILDKL
jgi:integrase